MIVLGSVFGEEEICYRIIGAIEKEKENIFRIIQEIREKQSRRLQEKKAMFLSYWIRPECLELKPLMMPLLSVSTVDPAVQSRKNEKIGNRITSATSTNYGTSDLKMQKGLQGQEIGSWELTNDANTAPCTKDQDNGSVFVENDPQCRQMHAHNCSGSRNIHTPTCSARDGIPRTCRSFDEHRPQQRRNERFPDTLGAVKITDPDMKGLFMTILLVFFMTLSSGQNHERPTDCHVDQELITQDWKLTCQFHVDISERRQDFQVFQLKRAGSPDLIVDGTWIEDELKAFTAEGYVVDGPVSDQVVIRMQSHVVHSGHIYTCTLPSTSLEYIKTCQVPKKEESVTSMLNLLQDVHNGARGSVNYEKMLLLITAAITIGIICRHI